MSVEPIVYLEWAKLSSQAKISLSRSGVPDLLLRDLPLTLEVRDLEISGRNPYGYEPLLEAIAHRYGVGAENVVLTQGASQAIFMVCAGLLEPDDRVVVEKPAYEPLLSCPRFFRAGIMRLERRFENKFLVDLDDYRRLLAQGAKLIILTNLHNPTGVFLNREQIAVLAAEADKAGAYLFIDEIYLEFMSDELSRSAFGLSDRVIVASSLTKVYGLGGLRCGWILASPEVAQKLRRLTDYLVVEGVFIGEVIAARLFPYLDQLRQKNRGWLEANQQLVGNFIAGEPKLSWVEPAGGVVCFPRLEAGRSGDEFSQRLRLEAEVSVVPGSFFELREHFRLGYAVSSAQLAKALEAIHSLLQKW